MSGAIGFESTIGNAPTLAATRALRNGVLDGWRGILALWVFLGHMDHFLGLNMPVLRAPGYAVDGFIVLSGYFIHASMASTAAKYAKPEAAWRFYRQRALRIWPAYAAVLIGSVVAFHAAGWITGEPREAPGTMALLAHVSLLNGLIPPYVEGMPIPSWSLSIELQFYALYPLIFFTGAFRSIVLAVVAFALALASPYLLGNYTVTGLWAHFSQPSLLTYRLFLFMIGVAWQREMMGERSLVKPMLAAAFVLNPFSAVVVLCIYLSEHQLLKRIVAPALESRAAQFFGRISYSLYVCHGPVIALAFWQIHARPSVATGLALVAAIVPATMLLSYVVHTTIEQRFHSVGLK